jgi:hypothetical protein
MPFFTNPSQRRKARERAGHLVPDPPPQTGYRLGSNKRLRVTELQKKNHGAYKFSKYVQHVFKKTMRMRKQALKERTMQRRAKDLRRSTRPVKATLKMADLMARKTGVSKVSVKITNHPDGTTVSKIKVRHNDPQEAKPTEDMDSRPVTRAMSKLMGQIEQRPPASPSPPPSPAPRAVPPTTQVDPKPLAKTSPKPAPQVKRIIRILPAAPPASTAFNYNGQGSCTMTLPRAQKSENVVLRLWSKDGNPSPSVVLRLWNKKEGDEETDEVHPGTTLRHKNEDLAQGASDPPGGGGGGTMEVDEPYLRVVYVHGPPYHPPQHFTLGDENRTPIDNGKIYSMDDLDTMPHAYQSAVSWFLFREEHHRVPRALRLRHPWVCMWA